MAQLTVRNVPDEIVRSLKIRAAHQGRSAEALRAGPADFWTKADALRSRSRKQRSDSAGLQREMRDER
jgi:hypothetical protein